MAKHFSIHLAVEGGARQPTAWVLVTLVLFVVVVMVFVVGVLVVLGVVFVVVVSFVVVEVDVRVVVVEEVLLVVVDVVAATGQLGDMSTLPPQLPATKSQQKSPPHVLEPHITGLSAGQAARELPRRAQQPKPCAGIRIQRIRFY